MDGRHSSDITDNHLLMPGKERGQEEKAMTEDEMAGWHHQLDGHEFEQTPGDSRGQGNMVCYSPWGCKESDTTEPLKNNNVIQSFSGALQHLQGHVSMPSLHTQA